MVVDDLTMAAKSTSQPDVTKSEEQPPSIQAPPMLAPPPMVQSLSLRIPFPPPPVRIKIFEKKNAAISGPGNSVLR